jgi:membrane-associated phospholipid phosphatase
MTSSQRILFAASLCTFMFFGTWVDTLHLHAFTAGLNLSIQEILSPLQTSKALTFVTHLGGNVVFALCSGVILLDLARRKKWRVLIYCTLTVLAIIGITHLFKDFTYSPRPDPFSSEYDSFPSGHTMRASLWCGLVLVLNQIKIYSLPRYARLFFIAIPLVIGFTRLALGRHWLDDVMGSYFLVAGALLILYWVLSRQKERCA